MDICLGSTGWVNSKTVVEFLLEEEAQKAYPRELAWSGKCFDLERIIQLT